MLPEKLILEAEEEQDKGIKTYQKKKIKGRVKGFTDHTKEVGYSSFSIRSYLSIIKAYHHFDIITPRMRGIWGNKVKDLNLSHDQLPTKEDIRRLLDVSDIRDQAIILLHLLSGMGSS